MDLYDICKNTSFLERVVAKNHYEYFSYTAKELPQPHLALALGLVIWKKLLPSS